MSWSDIGKKYVPWLVALLGWAIVAVMAARSGQPVPQPPPLPMTVPADSSK